MDVKGIDNDRIAGALVGLAAGDALGAGYEFTTPSEDATVAMVGGGPFGWEPGEWTDDTQMAVCIAEVTATGVVDLEAIGDRFLDWFRSGPTDVGVMTGAVLRGASNGADLPEAARRYHEANPDSSAGNGSLMRTAPVALAHLGDDDAIAEAAREVSALTHADPLCQEACVLWCIAIDRAVREGRLDGIHDGLELLAPAARDRWARHIQAAETEPPTTFTPNGFVVTALQAAHAAISCTSEHAGPWDCCHLPYGLEAAVRIGHDTDTVAAIAGQLLGARWGLTAVPFRWRRDLHGWPGYTYRDLTRLAVLTASGGEPDAAGWPAADELRGSYYETANPHRPVAEPLADDPGLIVGNIAGLDRALEEHDVDAVISMARIGRRETARPDVEHHEVMLHDIVGRNANLGFVLSDTVTAIETLRDEGSRVFLHCVGGTSRTPTVAALYLARRLDITGLEALGRVRGTIDHDPHNTDFLEMLRSDLPSWVP